MSPEPLWVKIKFWLNYHFNLPPWQTYGRDKTGWRMHNAAFLSATICWLSSHHWKRGLRCTCTDPLHPVHLPPVRFLSVSFQRSHWCYVSSLCWLDSPGVPKTDWCFQAVWKRKRKKSPPRSPGSFVTCLFFPLLTPPKHPHLSLSPALTLLMVCPHLHSQRGAAVAGFISRIPAWTPRCSVPSLPLFP